LYDMHGNVYEWCQDWFAAYPGGIVVDPQGPGTGSLRVFRGGSWRGSYYDLDLAWFCRSAYRYSVYPVYWDNYFGFRVVLAPGQP
jgi:formylglycine-generating enzyme required for sulfatase activity